MKTVLITGGAGFIGSNFMPQFLRNNPNVTVVNLDLLTYAADLANLAEVEGHPRYHFVHGDIRDRKTVEDIFERYNVQGVIHFAAESHVDNSIANPSLFVETNVNGTFVLLDTAYRYWMKGPFLYYEKHKGSRFHHISTDEVFGSLPEKGFFTEESPYAPNSPYSASKAGADMLVRSYHHTYGVDTVITNCSNNYGPHQHNEKLIPTIIRKAIMGEPIPIYGDGRNVRDWLFVKDHCDAVETVFWQGKAGESYNIGGRNERNNIEIAETACAVLEDFFPAAQNTVMIDKGIGNYRDLITFVDDRPGHDRRYAIDPSRVETELGWRASTPFEKGMVETVRWYVEKYRGI